MAHATRTEATPAVVRLLTAKNSKGHDVPVTRPPRNPMAPKWGLFHGFRRFDGVTVCTLQTQTFAAQHQCGRGFAGFNIKALELPHRVTT